MANVRNGNTFFIDTQHISAGDALAVTNIRVNCISVTATSANAILLLVDNFSNEFNKIELRVATSGDTKAFDFSATPIVFPNGIRVKTLTNAVATCIVSESQA